MSELLPCPFCGGEADTDRTMERFEYCTGGPNSVKDYGYYVYCTKCNASMGLINVPPSSPEEAAKEWNCRTPTIPPDVRDTLREALEWRIRDLYSNLPPEVAAQDVARFYAALSWLDAQGGGRNG